ncbi:hypothetical protein ACWD9K_24625 [Streptomyces sp. 900116325]|uniref:hypothetical protein n=1 Tax=unclassified Streptomyces TaxID=2593676 RepID=UPI0033B1F4C1
MNASRERLRRSIAITFAPSMASEAFVAPTAEDRRDELAIDVEGRAHGTQWRMEVNQVLVREEEARNRERQTIGKCPTR